MNNYANGNAMQRTQLVLNGTAVDMRRTSHLVVDGRRQLSSEQVMAEAARLRRAILSVRQVGKGTLKGTTILAPLTAYVQKGESFLSANVSEAGLYVVHQGRGKSDTVYFPVPRQFRDELDCMLAIEHRIGADGMPNFEMVRDGFDNDGNIRKMIVVQNMDDIYLVRNFPQKNGGYIIDRNFNIGSWLVEVYRSERARVGFCAMGTGSISNKLYLDFSWSRSLEVLVEEPLVSGIKVDSEALVGKETSSQPQFSRDAALAEVVLG